MLAFIRSCAIALCAALLLVAAACSGGAGTEETTIVYPEAPPDYHMYDYSAFNDETKWGVMNVHDPSVFKDGETYYIFSTDYKVGGQPRPGIMVRKSPDLIHWQWVGYALDGIPKEAEQWTGATNLWAPDVTKFGDTYYLYYAASSFGTNQSYIGLATSSSIEGPWTDQGEVFKTRQGDESNAIDPNIVFDAEGNPWLAYGSFFGGIYLNRLDPKTGKLLHYGKGKLIATRDHETVSGAVEGPYIV